MKRHLLQYRLFRAICTSFRCMQQAVIISPNVWVQRGCYQKVVFVTELSNFDMVQNKCQKRYFSGGGMFEDDDSTDNEDDDFDGIWIQIFCPVLFFFAIVNPLLHRYSFWHINNKQLLKTWEMSNFSFYHNVFYSVRYLYPICPYFWHQTFYLLLNWKNLKLTYQVKG